MADAGLIGLTQGDAPATVPSGLVRVYAKTDGKLYWKDNAGTEHQVVWANGSGSVTLAGELSLGAGNINLSNGYGFGMASISVTDDTYGTISLHGKIQAVIFIVIFTGIQSTVEQFFYYGYVCVSSGGAYASPVFSKGSLTETGGITGTPTVADTTDGRIRVAPSQNGNVYIVNRSGATRTFGYQLLAIRI